MERRYVKTVDAETAPGFQPEVETGGEFVEDWTETQERAYIAAGWCEPVDETKPARRKSG